jgi:hypothetical protein
MALACTLLLALLCLVGAPAAASSVAAAESAAVRAHEQWLSALDAQLHAEMTLEAASAAEAAADAQLELSDEMEEADAEESPRGTAGLSQAQEEEMAAMIEPAADTQLAEVASASTSSVRAFRNGPLVAPAPSPRGSKLTFKRTLPSRLKFKRMVSEAKDKLHDNRALTETSASTRTAAHAGTKAKAKAKSSVRSRARAHSRSRSRSRAGSDAPDGGEGDWTTAPSWWTPPGEENTRPWKEDDYSYMVRPRDPNSFINPSAAASFAAGRAVHPLLHRAFAGAPASVFAHQSPAVPPLPELDANMQPTNNYPNPPFYEHNYNKEYIWG